MDSMNEQMSDSSTGMKSMTGIQPMTGWTGQYDGEGVYDGDHVHCNRFNVPNSDHHYWTQLHPTALVDFVGSDCDNDAISYGCTSILSSDTACDGLDANGNGVYDCSDYSDWPETAWFR